MKTFSVIVLRPDYLANPDHEGCDIQLSHVLANDAAAAAEGGRRDVFDKDVANQLAPDDPSDYMVLLVTHDLISPALYGWQL